MSSKSILITRPEHDKVTLYLSSWAYEVIVYAKEKGYKVMDIGAEKVRKEIVEEYLSKQNPQLVILNGHGSKDSIAGHKDEVIIKKGDNEKLLSSKIVYALACHSGLELGPSAVNDGAIAFIGYTAPFCFLTDKFRECTPDDDPLANIFKEASNQVPFSLIKGKSAEGAYTNSQNKFKELIRTHGASDSMPEAKDIRFWLFWDMQSQILHGNPASTL